MKPMKITNKHMNYLNNIGTKHIVSLKKKPRKTEGKNFGELIQQKKNYILYASGNQKSYYELYPKETQFKSSKSKDKNNNIIKSKLKNKNQIYHNKSFISYRNNDNYIIHDPFESENILQSSENYGYKETRNVKHINPNLNVITVHDEQNQEFFPQREAHTVNIIKDRNIKIYKRDFNQYSERNQGIRIVKESKSTDNIVRRKGNYRIQINKEPIPNNHKSKIVKITKKKNGEIREIYQRKYAKKNNNINNNNNITHCYINNFGEKSFDSYKYYRNNENYYFKNDNIYNYNNSSNNRNKYFINNNYESNGYNLKNKFGYNKEIFGDEESKNIECPIHGNIAIVVHKKMNKINQMY